VVASDFAEVGALRNFKELKVLDHELLDLLLEGFNTLGVAVNFLAVIEVLGKGRVGGRGRGGGRSGNSSGGRGGGRGREVGVVVVVEAAVLVEPVHNIVVVKAVVDFDLVEGEADGFAVESVDVVTIVKRHDVFDVDYDGLLTAALDGVYLISTNGSRGSRGGRSRCAGGVGGRARSGVLGRF